MADAFICDAVRTPIGRYGGALAAVRTDDLAAVAIAGLLRRKPSLHPAAVEEGARWTSRRPARRRTRPGGATHAGRARSSVRPRRAARPPRGLRRWGGVRGGRRGSVKGGVGAPPAPGGRPGSSGAESQR